MLQTGISRQALLRNRTFGKQNLACLNRYLANRRRKQNLRVKQGRVAPALVLVKSMTAGFDFVRPKHSASVVGIAMSLTDEAASFGRAADLARRALPLVVERDAHIVSRLRMQAAVAAAAVAHAGTLSRIAGSASPSLQRLTQQRPDVIVGALVWPYICAGWDVDERLRRIVSHCRSLDRLGAPFPLSADDSLVLADLTALWPGLRLVMDQPVWFRREGGLTLNLFVGDYRAYSLSFSLSEMPDGEGAEVLIGSIQGRSGAAAKELYHDLTRAAHGMRPRDLLVSVLRMLCRLWGITRMLAVSNSHRHQRHPFFGGRTAITQDYDAIWRDREGIPEGEAFFRLPVIGRRRCDAGIKPNKRPLYHRRYHFLDELEARIVAGFASLTPVRIMDR